MAEAMPPEDFSDGETESMLFQLHNAAEAGDAALLLETIQARISAVQAQAAVLASTIPEGDLEAVVARALDLDNRDDDECTPLHVALLNGRLGCVELLLARGAQVAPKCEGSPPLHITASMAALPQHGDFALAATTMLILYGAPVYAEDDFQRTALHWAAIADHGRLCQNLIQAAAEEASRHEAKLREAQAAAADGGTAPTEGAIPLLPGIVSVTDEKGNTAIHLAARHGCFDALEKLLEGTTTPAYADRQALLLARNKAGQTALACAALAGCARCCEALLKAAPEGAAVADKRGLTPLQSALARGALQAATALGASQDELTAASDVANEGGCLLVTSPDCLAHHTVPMPLVRGLSDVPPENVRRVEVLVDESTGILRGRSFQACTWAVDCHPAAMTDVLRVHDWSYVQKVQVACERLRYSARAVGQLDSDTALSRGSFRAALKAAGSVCHAVDAVVQGRAKRAFCAVRPPGHHAGPTGVVRNENEATGSHGFCLLNNVAIGAAYAMSMYRHAGVKRVALLDFDVHHGNGTEACVSNTAPSSSTHVFRTPYSVGQQVFHHWRPWFDGDDRRNVLFASVQGYGRKAMHSASWVYPGSGATCDTAMVETRPPPVDEAVDPIVMSDTHPPADTSGSLAPSAAGTGLSSDEARDGAAPVAATAASSPDGPQPGTVPEDPEHEFVYREGQLPRLDGPRIINVGVPGPGTKVSMWRRAWRDKILPAVVNFAPDLIIVSAGFDAHRKDEINFQYVGVREHDFAWVTEQIVAVANRVCDGRVVSVLEGGYRIQGGVVSAFSRSVAAHVSALADCNGEKWNEAHAAAERAEERRRREAKAAQRERKAADRAAQIAAEVANLEAEAAVAAAADAATAARAAAGAAEAAAVNGPSEAATNAATAAAIAEAALVAPASVLPTPAEVKEAEVERPSKRRRGAPVDYVALDKELNGA